MNEVNSELPQQALYSDAVAVADDMRRAMIEVAVRDGDESIAGLLSAMLGDQLGWPDPRILSWLDEVIPGSARQVLSLMTEIQEKRHVQERMELRRSMPRIIGRSFLKELGFKSKNR